MAAGWEGFQSAVSSRHPSVGRTLRLDDATWRARERSLQRVRRVSLPLMIAIGGAIGFVEARRTGMWSWWWVVGPALFGAGVGGLVLAGLGSYPDSMTITAEGLEFQRPNGKCFTLNFNEGAKVSLLDQSRNVSRRRSGLGPYPPYVLANSQFTQTVLLTQEAFQAIREELELRGATLIRKGSAPMTPGSVLYVYRTKPETSLRPGQR